MNPPEAEFIRYGRTFHLRIESAADLRHALTLDEGLWVATSAPVSQLQADPEFLRLLDTDTDGRIKVGELKSCIEWLLDVCAAKENIDVRSDSIRPGSVNPDHPDGSRILSYLEKDGIDPATGTSLGEIRADLKALHDAGLSEAGVLLVERFEEASDRELAEIMISKTGGKPHPTGRPGADLETLERFVESIAQYRTWKHQQSGNMERLQPFGADTLTVFQAAERLRPRLERFFSVCRLVAMDPDTKAGLWPIPEMAKSTDTEPPNVEAILSQCLPAEPHAEGHLLLTGPLNPLDRADLDTLAQYTGEDGDVLTESSWKDLWIRIRPYADWLAAAPAILYETETEETLDAWLEPERLQRMQNAMAKARESALSVQNLKLAEKLALFQSGMLDIANNMVCMSWLYRTEPPALFEKGTLIMDGRRFTLAVKVDQRAEHIKSIKESSLFTLYVKVEHQGRQESYEVAVPVTSGTQGNLTVGKRGVFQDLDGEEWSARVEHIEDHPVSLQEAVLAPFQRLGGALTKKIESMSSEAEKKMETAGVGSLQTIQSAPAASTAAGMGGALAGGGIAIAALGSSLAFITKTLNDLTLLQVFTGLLGVVVAVLLPTTLVAWIKLRQRDLSGLLEGSGWAINSRMRLTPQQCRFFTQRPNYPEDSKFTAPVEWGKIAILAALILAILLQLTSAFK